MGLPVDALPLPDTMRRRLQRSVILAGMGRDASTGTVEFDGRELRTATDRSLDRRLFAQRVRETLQPSPLPDRRADGDVAMPKAPANQCGRPNTPVPRTKIPIRTPTGPRRTQMLCIEMD